MVILLVASIAFFGYAEHTVAQVSNREAFQLLAVECLLESSDTLDAFRLAAPDTMPYVRAALTSGWSASGKRVFLDDSSERELPVLRYRIGQARVSYAGSKRRSVAREVTLALQVTITRADGSILEDRVCTQMYADTLLGIRLSDLEDQSYPETRGEPPTAGWVRRYLEPVVTVGAIAVGVLLFFSLRSR